MNPLTSPLGLTPRRRTNPVSSWLGRLNPGENWIGRMRRFFPRWSWLSYALDIGTMATYTRASTAYHQQPGGTWVQVLSGESRYSGARRVLNGCLFSNDMTNAVWTVAFATKSQNQITFSANAEARILQAGTNPANGVSARKTISVSVVVSVPSGTGQFRIINTHASVVDYFSADLTATTTPKRFTFIQTYGATAGSGLVNVGIKNGTAGAAATFNLSNFQVEDITGLVAAPSEYVSRNVLSSPYHGANVDGVKYFSYANGNTVASNIVTEAQGAAIDPATISLLMEPVATNLCLQSQAAGTTWTQTNVTIVADAVAAPDGVYTADTLTATANNATWVQSTTAASTQNTWSIWIKRKTGTGAISMSLDGGSTYTEKTITANWARYSITQTLANPSMVLKIGVNTDAVWVWGSQLEIGAISTSYIPTTTAAVTRAVDALAYSGIPADNETRFVINGANVDVNDWNGTYPTPTVPESLKSITVYGPGRRPV